MNERVWLQAETKLVNKFLSICTGFLALLAFSGCGQQSEGEKSPSEQISSSIDEPDIEVNSISLSAIWGSEPLATDVIDMAIAVRSPGRAYVLAILADGNVELVDLDGISVAKTELSMLRSINNGFATSVEGQQLLAFPALTTDNESKLILASPSLQRILVAELKTPEEVISFCNSTLAAQQLNLLLDNDSNGSDLVSASILLESDAPEMVVLGQSGDGLICNASPHSIAIPMAKGQPDGEMLLVDSMLQEFEDTPIFTDELFAGIQDVEMPSSKKVLNIRSGLSNPAPTSISAVAGISGFVSVDYPQGLIAIAGQTAQGENRISYFSLATLVEQMGMDPTLIAANDQQLGPSLDVLSFDE